MSSDSCRICRGESTESQPLLHPCKCRGSIRYIHQECLLEWLKHSNKSAEQCDICHTPYKFKTIYDEKMPSRIPILLVWEKLFRILSNNTIKAISILLYVSCLVVQVPICWKFVGRIFTWALDGKLPPNNPVFYEALIYGGSNVLEASSTARVAKFFGCTYFSGLRYISAFVIIHIALFVEHEWVIRDEGYTKLLLKKIGKQPRTRLIDVLLQRQQGIALEGDDVHNSHYLEMIDQAIQDLQEQPDLTTHEEALRRAIAGGLHGLNEAYNNQAANRAARFGQGDIIGERERLQERPDVRDREIYEENTDEENSVVESTEPIPRSSNDEEFNTLDNSDSRSISEISGERRSAQDGENESDGLSDEHLEGPPPVAVPPFLGLPDTANIENDDNDADAGQRELEAAAVAAEAANGGGNGNIFELLGMSLNISTPIILMAMCDTLIALYLFLIYLVPHMLGTVVVAFLRETSKTTLLPTLSKASSFFSFNYNIINNFAGDFECSEERRNLNVVLALCKHILRPVVSTTYRLFVGEQIGTPTLTDRVILLTIGYAVIITAIYHFMRSLVSGPEPTVGTPRRIFKVLFEVSSTAKVFTIFAIEIFFFPLYCGWLLDFCASPILLPQLAGRNEDGSWSFFFLFSLQDPTLNTHYIRTILYWGAGTLYMLFFALFVGMVRGKILRPGVLFFIRSQDDPNARLIHDALVKPLSLQLNRIYLSAKVYTTFIIFGIGGVTWGLRYLSSMISKDFTLLPLELGSYLSLITCGLVSWNILLNKSLITKYSLLFWRRVFEISAHKLRLSHFILKTLIPLERGYVVYRNIWEQLLSRELPDYSKPVSYRESQKIFKENPDVKACFIPNGNYVRAPDNDTVSRRFIKDLFVPVTRDDRLLTTKNETENMEEDNEYESSDNEIGNDDAYTIVYRPPNFKTRCFGLLVMLWVFAVALILGIAILGLLFGKPIVTLFLYANEYFKTLTESSSAFNVKDYWLKSDLASIFVGIEVQLLMLYLFGERYLSLSGGQNQLERGAGFQVLNENFLPTIKTFLYWISVSFLLNTAWFIYILWAHYIHVDGLARLAYSRLNQSAYIFCGFLVTNLSIRLHLLLSFWTIVPYVIFLINFLQDSLSGRRKGLRAIYADWASPLMSDVNQLLTPFIIMSYLRQSKWGSNEDHDQIIAFIMLAIFIVRRLTKSAKKTYGKITEQVKLEKFVKGRAVQNIDSPEDKND